MKFSVNRKIFVDVYKRFLTTGQLSTKYKKQPQMKFICLEFDETTLVITGLDGTKVLNAQLRLPVTVIEEGEIYMSDAHVFLDYLNNFKGTLLTIAIGDVETIISDEKTTIKFATKDGHNKQALRFFKNNNTYTAGEVKFSNKDVGEYIYTPWFTIADGKELNSVSDIVLSTVKEDRIVYETTDVLTISAENEHLSRQYETDLDVTVQNKAKLVIEFLYPILNVITGVTEFYYHLLTSGKLRVWIHNKEIDWMVMYDELQP